MGGVRESVQVPAFSLDDLLGISPRPKFLKIDVEGAEAMVLSGASRLLNDIRPIIHIEVGKDNSDQVTNQLHVASYQIFHPRIPVHGQKPLDSSPFSTLAVPTEQISQLAKTA
jgi:hypothetical protein